MEARFGAEAHRQHHFYGNKRNLDWDLNDWKWDGDLFIATPVDRSGKEFFPLNSGVPAAGNSSNSSSSCSDEVDLGIERAKRELEKKRRVLVVEDHNSNGDPGTLSLKLGGHNSNLVNGREAGNWDGTSGKKGKVGNRAVCQVEGCAADLSSAKDYHRRHKVCEIHSKASKALVGNVMQRFCQQCSRFHVLQEFDEGKRSCRRRLAGHNKRRRKTNPENAVNGASLNDDQTSSFLLISLLRILSNMHSNRSDLTTDQDLVSHLVRSLANQSAEHGRTSEIVSALLSNCAQGHPRSINQHLPASEMPQQDLHPDNIRRGEMISPQNLSVLHSPPSSSEARQNSSGETKINNFDLNDIYVDSDDGMDDIDRSLVPANGGTNSLDCPSWAQQDSHQSSPQQTSRNSDSASAQSPSSSTGDAQSRTDRIVFKLFGKEPNDFPLVLRAQILDWLSQSPTDIESYIRPGCILLTIYLRQADAEWEELCHNLSYSLSRLLGTADDTFWTSGWIYMRVQRQMAFIYDGGQVAMDTCLPVTCSNHSEIFSVRPIAVSSHERVQFSIKGINVSRPSTRLLCALEGRYLEPVADHNLEDSDNSIKDHELQCVNFSCSIPEVIGRGFIEVEDNGLSSSFFPFIVAEEDVCAEIRMLEGALEYTESDTDIFESGKTETKNQALEFIHEIGWLLHRGQLKPRLGHSIPNADLFSLKRFKWLMDFSMDHDWCAVVRKLIDVFLDGTVGAGEHPSIYIALSDMGLLHRAVRRNSRPLVEVLIRYAPQKYSEKAGSENNSLVSEGYGTFLFRPDVAGPAGLTPLHIAAGKDGSEDVLDALTDDPGKVGVEAWKNARDSTGFTPEDYARLRGQYSYIHLIQRKINRRTGGGHLVLDIPDVSSDSNVNQKENSDLTASFEIGRLDLGPIKRNCKLCDTKLVYGRANRSLVYRPAMLSMVAIAAVCVCVALLFKSSPEVLYVFEPFRWERLHYGTI